MVPLLLALIAAPPPSVEGLWLNDDRKGIVRIGPCGRKLCGVIAKVLSRDPKAPKTDIHNRDPRLRGRGFLGLPVLTGFERDGNVWRNGYAYDPESGKSYKSSLQLNPDGSLRVTGCIFIFCESRRWTRVR